MYDTILVPTDGSATAEAATRTALGLARRFDASLHAVHVTERDDVPDDVESEATAELTRRGDEILTTLEEEAAETGIAATTRLLETDDPVHEAIVEYATDHDADLVVMGTRGRTGLDRMVLGSVTERTLRTSPVPVLTVHEDRTLDPNFETVLVPTDGSDAATAAADHGIALVAATGAAMHVVHVVDHTAVPADVGSGAVFDALQEAGQRAVDDLVDRAEEAGVGSAQASVLGGTPARAILDYAEDRDVDLVVMGTHGRTGLERHLIGSVTEKVVRLADGPVLTVSPSDGR